METIERTKEDPDSILRIPSVSRNLLRLWNKTAVSPSFMMAVTAGGKAYLRKDGVASPAACQCAGCLQEYPVCGCHIFLGLSLAHFSFLCMIKV